MAVKKEPELIFILVLIGNGVEKSKMVRPIEKHLKYWEIGRLYQNRVVQNVQIFNIFNINLVWERYCH